MMPPALLRPAFLLLSTSLLLAPAARAQDAAPPQAAGAAQLQSELQAELQIERKLLALDLVTWRESRTKEQTARDGVAQAMQQLDQALGGDALALGTLESLFTALTTARAAASVAADDLDWQLRRLQDRMRRISFLEGEIGGRALRETGITGRWLVQIAPTNQAGLFIFQLAGTALSGTYVIQGESSGSLRGDLSGNRLQIELTDTAGTLRSTFTGTFDPTNQRIIGTWLATELAAGKPAQGAWIAARGAGTERQP